MAARVVVLLFAWLLLLPRGALAESIQILVLTGDPTPDGLNTFDFGVSVRPGLFGQHVVFVSPYTGVTGDSGIFRGNPAGQLFTVAQTDDIAPSGKTINDLDGLGVLLPSVNSLGQLAYPAVLVSGPSFPVGLFRGNESERTEVFEDGDPAPGNGDLTLRPNSELAAVINEAGDMAFSAALVNTTGGSDDDEAIYRWDGDSGVLTEIVRMGDAPPDGDGTFIGTEFQASAAFAPPVMNEAGEVGFLAEILNSTNGQTFSFDAGVFRSDGNQAVRIARVAEAAPSGSSFTLFRGISMNEGGSVAFGAGLASIGTATSVEGIYRGNGTTITEIAESGDPIPGGGATYSSFIGSVDINDSGSVAFVASLDIFGFDTAVFVGDGTNTFFTGRRDEPATPGDGVFAGPVRFALNNASQLAFTTNLDVGGKSEKGLFLFDQTNGLARIARTGDALAGSSITDLTFNGIVGQFSPDITSLPDQADGLNDAGQVAFAFLLADGRRGIAIWEGSATPVPLLPGLLRALLAALLLTTGVTRLRSRSV